MANVTFKRNTREIINTTPIEDGQVLFETDQGNKWINDIEQFITEIIASKK